VTQVYSGQENQFRKIIGDNSQKNIIQSLCDKYYHKKILSSIFPVCKNKDIPLALGLRRKTLPSSTESGGVVKHSTLTQVQNIFEHSEFYFRMPRESKALPYSWSG